MLAGSELHRGQKNSPTLSYIGKHYEISGSWPTHLIELLSPHNTVDLLLCFRSQSWLNKSLFLLFWPWAKTNSGGLL